MHSVEYVECNQEHLILIDEEITYDIDFFNVIFYENSGREEACRILQDAKTIVIEEEKIVDNAYYIYVDEKLLQEIIVEKELGKQNIKYVGYLHNFEKNEHNVVADYQHKNRNNRSFYILGFLFLFLLLSLWGTFATYL